MIQPLKGGYNERIQVPVAARGAAVDRPSSGGRFCRGAASVDVKSTYSELGSRVGKTHKTVEVTAAAAAGGIVFMLAGALLSGLWFRRFP